MPNNRLWKKKLRMQSGANVTAQFRNNEKNMRNLYVKLHVYLWKKYSIIKIANYESAKIVDIRGTIYMYMYKETCK